jgi:hypothetical protein
MPVTIQVVGADVKKNNYQQHNSLEKSLTKTI